MGMFDSFIIKYDDKEIDIQTKQLDCSMLHFKLGDTVGDLNRAFNYIIVEQLYDKEFIDKYVSLIIVDGIFFTYLIEDTADEAQLKGSKKLVELTDNLNGLARHFSALLKEKNLILDIQKAKVRGFAHNIDAFTNFVDGKLEDCFFKKESKGKSGAFNFFRKFGWDDIPITKSKSKQTQYFLQQIKNRIITLIDGLYDRNEW